MKTKAKKKLRKRIARKLATALPATPLRIEVSHLTHWRTKTGEVLPFRDMEINHLLNARRLVSRRIARMIEVEAAMAREVALRLLAQHDDKGKYPAPDPGDARDWWDAYGWNGETPILS